jgi:hypothetical protein
VPQYLQGQPGLALIDKNGKVHPAWAAWFSTAHQILQDTSASGTTANRPINQLYVGKPYFDTTLGAPIHVKSTNPTVWVNGIGTVV